MPRRTRKYDTVINCKIAHKDIEQIDRICHSLGISRSDFIRGALRVHIKTFFGDTTE